MIGRVGIRSARIVRISCLCVFLGLVSGCLEKRIQWSPDGTRAAVITRDGLYLCDALGTLVPISSSARVYALAWLSDSEQMVVAASTDNGEPWLGVGRIAGSDLVLGDNVYRGTGVVDIRVAPGDRTFAFTVEAEAHQILRLLAAPMDGSQPPALVSSRAAAYPDWSADGRSLVYMEAENSADWEQRLQLGSLVKQQLVDEDGALDLSEPPTFLAGLAFATYSRVRCLADGRLIFDAAEFELPYSTPNFGGLTQLFMAAPQEQPTLLRLIPRRQRHLLPDHLSFFEVSPDESEILIATTVGEVFQLTLATGAVQVIQTAVAEEMKVAPVWRAPGEFTYVRIPARDTHDLRSAAVMLQQAGESQVLSVEWPSDLLDALMAD